MDSVKISGFIVLFIGVALLVFTFVSAHQLMTGVLDIATEEDLMTVFGEALAPLISYAIRALYLGIMGWIGSILTRRGVQTIMATPGESGKPAEEKPSEEAAAEQAG